MMMHTARCSVLEVVTPIHICRVVQLGSGGGGGGAGRSNNQVYNMLSITGDAVFIDFVPSVGDAALVSSSIPSAMNPIAAGPTVVL